MSTLSVTGVVTCLLGVLVIAAVAEPEPGENVCSRIITYISHQDKTVSTTRQESYREQCGAGSVSPESLCTRYRIGYQQVIRRVSRIYYRTQYYCCEGYEERLHNNSVQCFPIEKEDINCQVNNGGCDHMCSEVDGRGQCLCVPGFSLAWDFKSCIDINECQTSVHDCDHTCINTIGSYVCSCRTGYLANEDSTSCTDRNECGDNNGGCDQICTNLNGTHQCSCREGYVQGGNGNCQDVDECVTQNNGGCHHNCSNTVGSFQCSCSEGYHLGNDNKTCEDVNECLAENNGGCQHNCSNVIGGFRCSCSEGFNLGNDGKTCEEVKLTASTEGILPTTSADGVLPTASAEGTLSTASEEGILHTTSAEGILPTTSAEGILPTTSAKGILPTTISVEGILPRTSAEGALLTASEESAPPTASSTRGILPHPEVDVPDGVTSSSKISLVSFLLIGCAVLLAFIFFIMIFMIFCGKRPFYKKSKMERYLEALANSRRQMNVYTLYTDTLIEQIEKDNKALDESSGLEPLNMRDSVSSYESLDDKIKLTTL
ncbi:multiple epidermal growth factor-like domains protein 6 isoform X2 [Ptychodera flava]|uniref:multiple epidermal growth factor-like domains protein 6 isoform X2 n=1 Tax=Ptychodera flava TaxID=63121 RepID=UPI00396A29E9